MTPERLRAGDVVIGLVYLLVLALLLGLTWASYTRALTPSTDVTLSSSSAGNNLQTGADVKMRGVLVGRVARVRTAGSGATLDLQLDPRLAASIPAAVQARLLPKTLLGERFVSLVLPDGQSSGGQSLEDGDRITEDRSQAAIELQRVLDDLLPLLTAVQPEKLANTLGEMAAALDGRGEELGATLTEFGAYAGKLAPEVPQLADDLDRLASVADTYDSAAPDLLTALQDFTTFAKTQVDQRAQLDQLYADVTASAGEVSGFVEANSDNIIRLSRDSLPALDVTAAYSKSFPCTLQALTGLVPTMDKVLGAGTGEPGLHAKLSIVSSRGAYGAGDTVVPGASGAPTCPYVPTGTSVTAPSGGATAYRAPSPGPSATSSPVAVPTTTAGLGLANSPAENAWIAELVAPESGQNPSAVAPFASLLLGPAMRGSVVTVR